MKVYIKRSTVQGAWQWVQRGYKLAWEKLGYEAVYFYDLREIKPAGEKYYLQTSDDVVNNDDSLRVVRNAEKAFIYVQPNIFPDPWGVHPNFKCHCPNKYINLINEADNTFLWCFDTSIYHTKWKKVNTLPLAFDSVSYNDVKNDKFAYDVCYIGARADNGFDEKYQIMLHHFGKFRDSKLRIGIFINRNLTHEQENLILCNSRVCLNIHDKYQRTLVTKDTNERTFKSLGCNGILVSDREGFVPQNFPDVAIFDNPDQMIELTEHYLKMPPEEREELKNKHKTLIHEKHTYVNRVKAELDFEE